MDYNAAAEVFCFITVWMKWILYDTSARNLEGTNTFQRKYQIIMDHHSDLPPNKEPVQVLPSISWEVCWPFDKVTKIAEATMIAQFDFSSEGSPKFDNNTFCVLKPFYLDKRQHKQPTDPVFRYWNAQLLYRSTSRLAIFLINSPTRDDHLQLQAITNTNESGTDGLFKMGEPRWSLSPDLSGLTKRRCLLWLYSNATLKFHDESR